MSKPRRALPPEPDDQFSSDETELEISAIRRGMWLDESREVVSPRSAARAQSDDQDDEPTLSSIDLAPSGANRSSDADADAQELDQPEGDQIKDGAADPTVSGPASSGAGGVVEVDPPTAAAQATSRWRLRVLGVTALGLATALGLGSIPAAPAPIPEMIPLVTAISRICPVPSGTEADLRATTLEGGIDVRVIGQSQFTSEGGLLNLPGQTQPLVISPTVPESGVTGGSLVVTEKQYWWGACQAPLDDQYVQVPHSADAQLMIVNPELSDALVDVTLSGPDGQITGEGLRGITIEANSQHVIDLGALAGSDQVLGARVRTSLGRVSVTAQFDGESGADFATSTVQGTNLIVSAVPDNAERTVLLVTNPGTSRAIIQIEAVSQAGRFTLPSFESVPLNAQRTTELDLTDEIGGLPVSLVISSGDPIAVSAVITDNDDLGLEPARAAGESVSELDLLGVVPSAGTLQLVNPSAGDAYITVDWGERQADANQMIAAGTIGFIPIPGGAESVRVTSTSPLFGALLLRRGAEPGFAIAQLEPAARAQSSMPVEIDVGLGR